MYKVYGSINFYRHISQVTILDPDIENFHHPRSFSYAPPLPTPISQSGFSQHKLNLSAL